FLEHKGKASKKEIFAEIGYTAQKKNVEKYLNPLLERKLIIPTIKDVPTSPLQKYVITNAGKGVINFKKSKE
ncbi:MAG: Fic family protein, partial [Rikenellaceae bacterium]